MKRRITLAAAMFITGMQIGNAASINVPQPALPAPLTLQQAITIGLQNQSAVGIAGYELSAASARVTEANSAYFPQVTPSFTYTNQRNTGHGAFLGTVTPSGEVTNSSQTTELSVKETIFDNGSREENAAASRNDARAAQYGLQDTRQNVILTITTDYYNILRDKELARVAQANVDTTHTTLESTQASADAGVTARKDVLQAQANYDNAQVQLITANNNVSLSAVALKNAMGVYGAQPIVTPDTPLPTPSPTPDTKTVDDYMQVALKNRPDIAREANLIDAGRHNEHLANANAGLQVSTQLSAVQLSQPSNQSDQLVTLQLSYPLFDAGNSRGKVREAEAALEESRLQAQQTVENAQQSVTQAYLIREASRNSTSAAQAALKAAQENYAAAQESQKEGLSTIVDVITAQTALITAETNAVQAVYDYYTADAELSRAIGANDPANTGGLTK